jgi:homeobox protein Nkx-2.1
VKDGKPCSGGNSNTSQHHQQQNQSQQQQQQQQQGSQSSVTNVNGILTTSDGGQTHSPDTATTLLSSYNSGHNSQMLQQPCNNALMSNSLAMAYRNQNNFMSNSHQQQCGSYLPLQGRAW